MEIARAGKHRVDSIRTRINERQASRRLDGLEEGKFYGLPGVVTVDQFGMMHGKDDSSVDDHSEYLQRFGTNEIDAYEYWAKRACGAAAALTLLKAHGKNDLTLYGLIQELLASNGYVRNRQGEEIGWKHAALQKAIKRRGLNAELAGNIGTNRVVEILSEGRQFIASITSSANSGGHLVAISGMEWHPGNPIFSLHDPFNRDGRGGDRAMSTEELTQRFTHRGIIVWNQGLST